jgi:hypothetical protein
LIATALVARTGDRLAWLWYPIGLSIVTLVVGGLFVRDRVGAHGSGFELQGQPD